ncbi:MAG TPA: hypothetical protein VIO14_12065 [Dehalococcoidia bacterium]
MDLDAAVAAAVERTVAEHGDVVEGWLADRPKTWGFLAGRAVVACRALLGRPLTEAERRLVWDRLWRRLQELRAGGAPGP